MIIGTYGRLSLVNKTLYLELLDRAGRAPRRFSMSDIDLLTRNRRKCKCLHCLQDCLSGTAVPLICDDYYTPSTYGYIHIDCWYEIYYKLPIQFFGERSEGENTLIEKGLDPDRKFITSFRQGLTDPKGIKKLVIQSSNRITITEALPECKVEMLTSIVIVTVPFETSEKNIYAKAWNFVQLVIEYLEVFSTPWEDTSFEEIRIEGEFHLPRYHVMDALLSWNGTELTKHCLNDKYPAVRKTAAWKLERVKESEIILNHSPCTIVLAKEVTK